jgi:type II secretion system protein H
MEFVRARIAYSWGFRGIFARNRPSFMPFCYRRFCYRQFCHRQPRGFTLVEILVVIVIIGIGLSLVVSNLFVSEEERVRQEAERVLSVVEQTRDQAAFSGYAIAMRLNETGIEFLERDPNKLEPVWNTTTRDTLAPRAWAEGIRAELRLAGANRNNNATTAANNKDAPQITFMPAGIGAPFTIRVFSDRYERIIVGDALGNVKFDVKPSP